MAGKSRRIAMAALLALGYSGGDAAWGDGQQKPWCGTREVSQKEVIAIEVLLGEQAQKDDKKDDQQGDDEHNPEARLPSRVHVPVHAHVIHDGKGGYVDARDVGRQIDALNGAYGGKRGGHHTAFRFELAGIDRTDNKVWYHLQPRTPEERAMKSALHKGGPGELNLYIAGPGDDLLGWATFPQDYPGDPMMDGVVIAASSLPGGSAPAHNQGDVATHEVGHWLGLYHTFQGGCTEPGDAVKDTPPQGNPTFGCPKQKDTCPDDGGPGMRRDPFQNFMDYTDDACMNQFTRGQGLRMNWMWQPFREDRCGDGTVDLGESCDIGIPAGLPGACPVECDDGDPCTGSQIVDAGTCLARCVYTPAKTCP
jgi:hypothetical protein